MTLAAVYPTVAAMIIGAAIGNVGTSTALATRGATPLAAAILDILDAWLVLWIFMMHFLSG
jgi:hypothetical protein